MSSIRRFDRPAQEIPRLTTCSGRRRARSRLKFVVECLRELDVAFGFRRGIGGGWDDIFSKRFKSEIERPSDTGDGLRIMSSCFVHRTVVHKEKK